MMDNKSADINTSVVYKCLRDQGDKIKTPLDDNDVALIVKDTIKLTKAQLLVREQLEKLGVIKK